MTAGNWKPCPCDVAALGSWWWGCGGLEDAGLLESLLWQGMSPRL